MSLISKISQKINIMKYFFILFFVFIFTSSATLAQEGVKYKLSTGEQSLGNRSTASDCDAGYFCVASDNISGSLQMAFNLVVGIAISVAVVLLILNGINGALSSFGVDVGSKGLGGSKAKDLKESFTNPVVGLIIVLISVIAIRLLNPDLLEFYVFDLNSINSNIGGGTSEASGATIE